MTKKLDLHGVLLLHPKYKSELSQKPLEVYSRKDHFGTRHQRLEFRQKYFKYSYTPYN